MYVLVYTQIDEICFSSVVFGKMKKSSRYANGYRYGRGLAIPYAWRMKRQKNKKERERER